MPTGRAARAGGWGYVLADEGSGFWLGKEALRAVLRAADSRGPATALTGPVLATLRRRAPAGPRARSLSTTASVRAAIAELATVVETAAAAGDHGRAASILDTRSARAHAAGRLGRRAARPAEGPIVLAGGTLRAAPRLATGLVAALNDRLPRAETRLLDVEPAYGAVRLAIALVRGTCGCRRTDRT